MSKLHYRLKIFKAVARLLLLVGLILLSCSILFALLIDQVQYHENKVIVMLIWVTIVVCLWLGVLSVAALSTVAIVCARNRINIWRFLKIEILLTLGIVLGLLVLAAALHS